MKKHLFIIILLILGINIEAKTEISKKFIKLDELTFKDNKISLSGKLLGKFDLKITDVSVGKKEKTTVYDVTIFDENDSIIAKLNLQMINKSKKESFAVAVANLKTLKDNVSHNPANFIKYDDFENSNELEVPQFDNVVRYLISYHYF